MASGKTPAILILKAFVGRTSRSAVGWGLHPRVGVRDSDHGPVGNLPHEFRTGMAEIKHSLLDGNPPQA